MGSEQGRKIKDALNASCHPTKLKVILRIRRKNYLYLYEPH